MDPAALTMPMADSNGHANIYTENQFNISDNQEGNNKSSTSLSIGRYFTKVNVYYNYILNGDFSKSIDLYSTLYCQHDT